MKINALTLSLLVVANTSLLEALYCDGIPCSPSSPYDCMPKHWHCDGMNDCGDNSDESHCHGSIKCGVQAPRSAIFKGHNAYRGQYPWLAKITSNFRSSAFACGASLISDQWLVTAAHCLEEGRQQLES